MSPGRSAIASSAGTGTDRATRPTDSTRSTSQVATQLLAFLPRRQTGSNECRKIGRVRYELFEYQGTAATQISKSLIRLANDHRDDPDEVGAVVLSAPTGAGKTVIATAVVEGALDGDETTPGIETATFLWVTDDPSLNRQTLAKMMAASSALAPNRLHTIENDFDEDVFAPGSVYFLNIQKLAASATLARGGTNARQFSLWDTIANTAGRRPFGFVVVVDEAHRGVSTSRSQRDSIVSQIIGGGGTGRPAVPVVWGISATPTRFREAMSELGRNPRSHSVLIGDVRDSGLLKDEIVVGHTAGVDAAESTLVRHGVQRLREYERAWNAYTSASGEPRIDPILVIQVGDKPTERDLFELMTVITDEWPAINQDNVVHTFASHSPEQAGAFSIEYCPPEDIQDRHDVRVVIAKTAITTGWDCPRAEILVSLRVAKDIDLITQIMGRMVRTPLARRVLTDETLNSVRCILPKFDAEAVAAIATRFEAGDEGLTSTRVVTDPVVIHRNPQLAPTPQSSDHPDGFEATRWLQEHSAAPRTPIAPATPTSTSEVQPAPSGPDLFEQPDAPSPVTTASGEDDVYSLLTSLPSYTIPRRTQRSSVGRLRQLASLAANTHEGIVLEPQAPALARNALIAVINNHRADLEVTGRLEELVDDVANTKLYERTVTFGAGEAEPERTVSSTLPLDARGIRLLLNRATSRLPEGLANDYINHIAPDDDEVFTAQVLTIALAGDPALGVAIEGRASQLIEDWFLRWDSKISRLSTPEQERFDRIKREADRPLRTTIALPDTKHQDDRGKTWPRHVLSDAEGNFRADLKSWEEYVLQAELEHGAIAWYRNPSYGKHSLQIPYTTAAGVAGLAPDFIFIHQVAGELVASIIDPHGTHLADAAPKLKGLAQYAETHHQSFHRIQSIAVVEGSYRMLNHRDPQVREAVAAHSGADAESLFVTHGSAY